MTVWDSLIGQAEAIQQFREAAVAAGQTPPGSEMTHAWLVTGPPGSGRSVIARSFAAALVCPQAGCGECQECLAALAGRHPDIEMVIPEGVNYKTADARELVTKAAIAPLRARWHVLVIEDADRLTETANNVLLKAIEEPSAAVVWVLCTPSVEDVLPTVRSRCRLIRLATPEPESIAEHLATVEGLDQGTALFAAQAAQGHVGRARALALDAAARERRNRVLRIPAQLGDLGSCLRAAQELADTAKADALAATQALDESEMADLLRAWGEGAEGRGVRAGARGIKGAQKELEDRQKSRRNRMERDELDRALLDLLGFYRDIIRIQLSQSAVAPPSEGHEPSQGHQSAQGQPTQHVLINGEHRVEIEKLARHSTPYDTLGRIEAVERARQALIANVTPQLALEALTIELRSPQLRANELATKP